MAMAAVTAAPRRSFWSRRRGLRRGKAAPGAVPSASASESSSSPAAVRARPRGDGLVMPVGDSGGWDGGAVGGPVVRCLMGEGGKERWSMWYHGRPPTSTSTSTSMPTSSSGNFAFDHDAAACTGRIGLATSTDGLRWTRGAGLVSEFEDDIEAEDGACSAAGIVLEPNPGDWWCFDTAHVGVGDVTLLGSNAGGGGGGGGVFWMFYHGGNMETRRVGAAEVKGVETRIGVALSQDGTHWSRVEGNHHTGALLDVGDEDVEVSPDDDTCWDRLCMMRPCIVTGDGGGDSSKLRMYYHSIDSETGMTSIGMATSADGFNWTKRQRVLGPGRPGSFDEGGVKSCHVVRDKEHGMVMVYEGVDAAGRMCIGAATSTDGIDWERCAAPILEPSADTGAWDAGGVGSPFPVPMAEGRWRLYYEGRPSPVGGTPASGLPVPSPPQGIGLAVSSKDGLTKPFTRKGVGP